MAQINVSNLSFAYENASDYIFKDVNFVIDTDWKLGFVGRNGRGKTTFLNLLLNKYEYKGKIQASVNFDYFPFEVKNKDKLAIEVLDEVYPDYELWKVMKNLNELNLGEECLYKPYSVLSNGEQTKLLLAVLFTKENNFLLIDEPTNHLDYSARKIVCEFLNKQKGFVVVSHDRKFLDNCIDHVLSINKNNIEVQKGNFSSWWQNKLNQDEFELKQNEKLAKDISALKRSMEQTQMWSDRVEKTKNGTRDSGVKVDKGYVSHKAAKMAQRSKSIEVRQSRAIDEKSKLLKNIEQDDEIFFIGNNSDLKGNLVEVKNLQIKYGCIINYPLTFQIDAGDKIALMGDNGCGKSSLFKKLLGENIECDGTIYKNSKLKISYVSQNFDYLSGSLNDFCLEYGIDRTKLFTLLIKFGLTRKQLEYNLADFSAGQKKKVLLAKSLCEDADLYIWDEPLNYIDIISRMQIEELLSKTKLTIIFVEHDISFVECVATKTVEIKRK